MEWWQILLIGWVVALILLVTIAFIVWRKASARTRRLATRLQWLSWTQRFQLMGSVSGDESLPPSARFIMPALLLYLSLPLDLIPDFIPVIGQIDDALAVGIGIGLMRGSRAWQVLESRLLLIEAGGHNEHSPRRGYAPGPPPTPQ